MKLEEQLYDVKRVAIAGHVKPDGDCVGSTLAVYNYIRKYHPEMEVELHLEPIPNIFKFLANADKIDSSYVEKSHTIYLLHWTAAMRNDWEMQ